MSAILVVDDRSINRTFLAALLGYAGHTVVEAVDGSEALSLARRSRPDLIITDLKMPVMDGLELGRLLRADSATADIPVIFYTAAYREIEAREMMRSCGVDRILPKPSEPQAILDAVARVLGAQSPAAATADERERKLVAPEAQEQHVRRRLADDDTGIEERFNLLRRVDASGQPATGFHALSLRVAALLELGLTLGAERNPQAMLDRFCLAAQDIIGVSHAGVIVVDAERDAPLQWSASGVDDAARADLNSIDLVHGFLAEVMQGQKPVCLPLLGGDATRAGLPKSHPSIGSLLAAPIRSPSGRVRGVLFFADKISGTAFDDDDLQFAATLATQLALSYGNLKLFEDMRRHADELRIEIVERKQAQEALRESNEKFNQLADHISDAFWIRSADMRDIEYVSQAFERIWGRSISAAYANPHEWVEYILRDDRVRVAEAFARFVADTPRLDIEYRIVRPDGAIRWVRVRGFHIRDAQGKVLRLAGIVTDITERREQRDKIVRLSRIHSVISGISSASLRLRDRDELLREACRVATTEGVFPIAWISAIDPQTGQSEIVAWHGEDPHGVDVIMKLNARQTWRAQDRPSYRAAHSARPVVINDLSTDPTMAAIRPELMQCGYRACAAFPLCHETSVVAVLVLLASELDFFDAEEVKLLEWLTADLSFALGNIQKSRRLEYLALYDALTGLPNARLFSDRLEHLVHAARQDDCPLCVVVIDLERFTRINDARGRHVGDALLQQVGKRLEQFLVEPYALGRISADTFAAASARDGEHIATKLYERMLEALDQPFQIDGCDVGISMQAGIALFPADGADGREVFRNAEAALKLAKSSGERHAYHSSEMNARIAQQLALADQLRAAVDAQQFVLHYQWRVDMISGERVGAEALIRWQHPQLGLLAPAGFIALAEETGLIVAIGAWVIDTVCAQQAAWIAAKLPAVPIAVNVSSVQFEKSDFLQTVRHALATHHVDAKLLDLELTESVVMSDSVAAAATLKALRKLGIGLALDDFGTGYSSLAHLKRFPFNSVKIDRSFVTDITRNAEDAAIATAIIAMAHSLNLKVVAEGVETLGQFNYLRAQACDEMQGFFYNPAVATDQFEADLRSGQHMKLPETSPLDQRTLLLVDDEPGIRSALTRMFRRDGYRILTAASGLEALDLLAINAVQVIISDQRMPGMCGTEFLNTVKQLHPDTVRIILSGYTDLEVVTESVNRGAVFKFLTKPWDDDLLREQVRDAFRRYMPESIH